MNCPILRRRAVGAWLMVWGALFASAPVTAHAAVILMHGREDGPTFRDDGVLYAHLQSVFGDDNVVYMRGASAAADGSSANGFDAIVISSSLASVDLRGKYEDTPVGVLNMENAIVQHRAGDFNMTESGTTSPSIGQTQINIVDPTDPLAAGLSGTVTVFNSPHPMQIGRGGLGPGVRLIAATGDNPDDHAIFAVDAGGALLGDGTPESPSTAAGRRVMFFVSDPGFADLTPDGLRLFDAALAWVTPSAPEPATLAPLAAALFSLLRARAARRK